MSHLSRIRSKCVPKLLPRSYGERILSSTARLSSSSTFQTYDPYPYPYPYSTNYTTIHSIRYFSSSRHSHQNDNQATPESDNNKNDNDNDKDKDEWEEDEDMKKRNKSILVNPNGISHTILPNQMVYKINPKTGEKRRVHQVAIGSFWMVKDLRDTQNKPILSNTSIIPAEEAQLFPPLKGLTSLTGQTVDLPDVFIKHDGTSETSCTLVAISYKDFGFKMLPKWTIPFENAFAHTPLLASVVHLTITEGTILKLLSGFLKRSIRNNTPLERHDSTYLHFGTVESFRDVLRMHNTLTGYLVLLDGLGRVRWMGSGEPSSEDVNVDELQGLIQSAQQLVSGSSGNNRERTEAPKRNYPQKMRKKVPTGRVGKKT